MSTSKKAENIRRYKLKAARAKIKLDEIQAEHVATVEASASWQTVRAAILARLDRLPDELLAGVPDRTAPGIVQGNLQRVIYACLTELSGPSFIDAALSKRGR